MNVLFISSQPFPYGMAGSKRVRLFAEFLAKNNTVKVFVIGNNNGRNDNEGEEKTVNYKFIRFSRIQSVLNFIRVKKILRTNFKKDDKNIIFLYDGIGLTNFWFALVGKKIGFKVVTDIVEDYSLHKENIGILLSVLHKINIFFEKRTYLFVDGVIVISSRLKKKFQNLKISEKKIEIIPVSAENIYAEKGYPQIENENCMALSDCFTYVYSGSYGNKDGVEILIKAFRQLLKKKTRVKLLLAGKITDKIANLIIDEKAIKYIGMIPDEDYYQFLNRADVLLMTRVNSAYANTGFPFKLGEYLASGKPVIATRVSDIEIYLKDKEDVILAEPSDIESLCSAFEYAVEHRTEIVEIGKNGKNKCQMFFNPEVNGRKLEIFLNSTFS